jgi:hypothetical protein
MTWAFHHFTSHGRSFLRVGGAHLLVPAFAAGLLASSSSFSFAPAHAEGAPITPPSETPQTPGAKCPQGKSNLIVYRAGRIKLLETQIIHDQKKIEEYNAEARRLMADEKTAHKHRVEVILQRVADLEAEISRNKAAMQADQAQLDAGHPTCEY